MGLTAVKDNTYWKRRQVGIDYDGAELHEHIEVGTFIQVERTDGPHWVKGVIQHRVVGKMNHWACIQKKIFTIFFQEVTKQNELGLIKLIEMDDHFQFADGGRD